MDMTVWSVEHAGIFFLKNESERMRTNLYENQFAYTVSEIKSGFLTFSKMVH